MSARYGLRCRRASVQFTSPVQARSIRNRAVRALADHGAGCLCQAARRRFSTRAGEALTVRGLPALRLMRSAGGTAPWRDLAEQPIGLRDVRSLRGTARRGWHASGPPVPRSFWDIGGTSADISILLDGRPTLHDALDCGGLPIRQRCADITSIGFGGGSVVSVLPGGALRLGPRSQGAWPGPAAFGLGGDLPTLSDALCVLDRLPPRLAAGWCWTAPPRKPRSGCRCCARSVGGSNR